MNKGIGILLCCGFPLAVSAAEPVNDDNWQNHPEIKKIRALYNEVNTAEKSGKFRRESRKCVLYGGSFEISGVLNKDQKGVVRKYVVDAGSGDSVGKAEYYYDKRGIPRFTYRTRAAYNGAKKWDRIYFDEKGVHLYTNHKQEGPGYPGSDLEDSIEKPAAHYADLCNE
jgi:hypothetical protein